MKLYPIFVTFLIFCLGLACASKGPGGSTTPEKKDDASIPKAEENLYGLTDEDYAKLQVQFDDIKGKALKPEELAVELKSLYDQYSKNPEAFFKVTGIEDQMVSDTKNIPVGVILVVIGLFVCYMGRRYFKTFLMISGFIVGGSLGLYFAVQGYHMLRIDSNYIVIWAVSLIAGTLGGYMFFKAWKVGVFFLSAYGGALLSIWLLGVIHETKLYSQINRNAVILVFALIGGLATELIDEAVVVFSSALMGSLTAVFGADMIQCMGFRTYLVKVIQDHDYTTHALMGSTGMSDNIKISMLVALFLTVSGVYIQYRYHPRSYDRD